MPSEDPHYRQVFLDGRAHPKDPDPTWQGTPWKSGMEIWELAPGEEMLKYICTENNQYRSHNPGK